MEPTRNYRRSPPATVRPLTSAGVPDGEAGVSVVSPRPVPLAWMAPRAPSPGRWGGAGGALGAWDNRGTRHRGIGDISGFHRRLHRIVLRGDAPV